MLEKILMAPEIRSMNFNALFSYVRERIGVKAIDEILEDIGLDKYSIKKKEGNGYEDLSLKHIINDPDYFISNELSLILFENIRKYLPGDDPLFEAGRYSVSKIPEIKNKVAWVKLVSPNVIFSKVSKENARYNKTKSLHPVFKQGEVELTVVYHPEISRHNGAILTKDVCDWNRGMYHGYIELTGSTDIVVKEKQCSTNHKDSCVFTATWTNPSLSTRIKNFFVNKWFPDMIEGYQTVILEREATVFQLEELVKQRTSELIKSQDEKHLLELDLALGEQLMEVMHSDTSMIINPVSTHFNTSADVLSAWQDYKKALEKGKNTERAFKEVDSELQRMIKTQEYGRGVIDDYRKNFKALHELRASNEEKRNPNTDLTYLQALVNSQFAFTDANMELDLAKDIPIINLGKKVQSSFLELAINSVKHGKATKLLAKTEYLKNDNKIGIYIYDNGVGIVDETSLFQDGKSGSNSTGTGLHRLKARIERNGGQVKYQKSDIPEFNTEFIIYLPIK